MAGRGGNKTRLLVIVLLVTSLLFITLDLRGVSLSKKTRSISQSVFTPFEKIFTDAFSPVGNFFSNIKNFPKVKSQLNDVKAANARLKNQLLKDQDLLGSYKDLQKNFNLAGKGGMKIIPARVIARGAAASFSQTITIDIGSGDGISSDMTVMNGDGVVGVVKSVNSHTAIVQLMSDPNFKMGVRIVGTGSAGLLQGEGDNQFVFQLLDPQGSLSNGEALVSLGSDQGRPFVPGLPVGYITAVNTTARDITQQGTVKSYANLDALNIVSVVVKGAAHDPRDTLIPPAPVVVTPTPVIVDTNTAATSGITSSASPVGTPAITIKKKK